MVVQYLSDQDLRDKFNQGPYLDMIAQGLLYPSYLRNDHLKEPEKKGNPWCTRSQTIRYLDAAGKIVVEICQYLRPDGSLGASGRPDPKRLWIGNTVLIAESQRPTGISAR